MPSDRGSRSKPNQNDRNRSKSKGRSPARAPARQNSKPRGGGGGGKGSKGLEKIALDNIVRDLEVGVKEGKDIRNAIKELDSAMSQVRSDAEKLAHTGAKVAGVKSPAVLPSLVKITEYLKELKNDQGTLGLKHVVAKMVAPPEYLAGLDSTSAKKAYGYFGQIFANMDRVAWPSVFEMGWLLLTHAVRPYYICMASAQPGHVTMSRDQLSYLLQTKLEAAAIFVRFENGDPEEEEQERNAVDDAHSNAAESAEMARMVTFVPFVTGQEVLDEDTRKQYADLLATLVDAVEISRIERFKMEDDFGDQGSNSKELKKSGSVEISGTLLDEWLKAFIVFIGSVPNKEDIIDSHSLIKLCQLYAANIGVTCDSKEHSGKDSSHEKCRCDWRFSYDKLLEQLIHHVGMNLPHLFSKESMETVLSYHNMHPTVEGYQAIVKLYEQAPCTPFTDYLPALIYRMDDQKTHEEGLSLLSLVVKSHPGTVDGKMVDLLQKYVDESSKDPKKVEKYLSIMSAVATECHRDLFRGRTMNYVLRFEGLIKQNRNIMLHIVSLLCHKGTLSKEDAHEALAQLYGEPDSRLSDDIDNEVRPGPFVVLESFMQLADHYPAEVAEYREFIDKCAEDEEEELKNLAKQVQLRLDKKPDEKGSKACVLL